MNEERGRDYYLQETLLLGDLALKGIRRVKREGKLDEPCLLALYFFAIKSWTSLKAVKLLWDAKLHQDALMLSRSIFETYVNSRYMLRDPEANAEKFFAHELVMRQRFNTNVIGSSRRGAGKAWRVEARALKSLKKISKHNFNLDGWSGKSLRSMVIELDDGRKSIWSLYEFLNALQSAALHSTSMSVEQYLRLQGGTRSYNPVRRPPIYLGNSLLVACSCCLDTMLCAAKEHAARTKDMKLGRVAFDLKCRLDLMESDARPRPNKEN